MPTTTLTLTPAQLTALARDVRTELASNPDVRGVQFTIPDPILWLVIATALNKIIDPLHEAALDAGDYIREKEEVTELRLEKETGTKPDLKLNAMATGGMERGLTKLEKLDSPWADAAAALGRASLLPRPR
jgi:hypothetical protein